MSQLKPVKSNTLLAKNRFSTHSFVFRLFEGMSRIFPAMPRDYQYPPQNGFSSDARAMQNDFGNVGKAMRRTLKKHEQTQAN